MTQKSNLPDLSAAKDRCLGFERQIAAIGRDKVAKAIEYGHYLNDLYDQYFTAGGQYHKQWVTEIEAWGLNRKTLDNYRLIASEAENMVDVTIFSSLTDAYEAARNCRKEREEAEARAAAEKAAGRGQEA